MNLLLNSRLPWFLICLLALTAAQAESQASLSWETFKSEAGNFSIEFPSPPKAKKTEQDSIVGHVINHIFESRSPSGDFSVDYSDLPGFAVAFTGNDTIYNHATGALLKKTLGKLQSNKDITCQGHSDKHLVYDIPQASGQPEFDGQAYLFLVINVYMSLTLSHRQILEYPRLSISSIVCTLIKTCIAQCSINTWHGNYAEQRFSPRDSNQVPAKLHHTYRSTTAIMESYCRR